MEDIYRRHIHSKTYTQDIYIVYKTYTIGVLKCFVNMSCKHWICLKEHWICPHGVDSVICLEIGVVYVLRICLTRRLNMSCVYVFCTQDIYKYVLRHEYVLRYVCQDIFVDTYVLWICLEFQGCEYVLYICLADYILGTSLKMSCKYVFNLQYMSCEYVLNSFFCWK